MNSAVTAVTAVTNWILKCKLADIFLPDFPSVLFQKNITKVSEGLFIFVFLNTKHIDIYISPDYNEYRKLRY